MPIVDEKAPRECDFDAMLSELKGADANTACVFNCQMGKGRTTTGMIVACLIRDVLSSNMPSYTPMQVWRTVTSGLDNNLFTGFRRIRMNSQTRRSSSTSSTDSATSR